MKRRWRFSLWSGPEAALAQTDFEVKPVILMILAGLSAVEAVQRLQPHNHRTAAICAPR